jgi:putative ABC transport system substrate-binding protein
VSFSIRFTEGKSEAMPAAAQELLRAGVDLIFTTNEAATLAAKEATQTIPIVFAQEEAKGAKIVGPGFPQTIHHPDRFVTGDCLRMA